MSKFAKFHTTLTALLEKLADENYSLRDILDERYWWIKAGCPIEPEQSKTSASINWNFVEQVIGKDATDKAKADFEKKLETARRELKPHKWSRGDVNGNG